MLPVTNDRAASRMGYAGKRNPSSRT